MTTMDLSIDIVPRQPPPRCSQRRVGYVVVATALATTLILSGIVVYNALPSVVSLRWQNVYASGSLVAPQQPSLTYHAAAELQVETSEPNVTRNDSSPVDQRDITSWNLVGRLVYRDEAAEWTQYIHATWFKNSTFPGTRVVRLAGFQLPGLGQDRFRLVSCEPVYNWTMPAVFERLQQVTNWTGSDTEELLSSSTVLLPAGSTLVTNLETGHPAGIRQELERVLRLQEIQLDECRTIPRIDFPTSVPDTGSQSPPVIQSVTSGEPIIEGCREEDIGNGICNEPCNTVDHAWDGGDCCAQTRKIQSASRYNCRGGPVVLLLHGAGWDVENSAHLDQQFSDVDPKIVDQVLAANLWGVLPRGLRDYASRIIFNSHNTRRFGWHDPDLQRALYDKAKQVLAEPQGGIVISHSLASLTLAGACANQSLCDVQWISLAAPLRGAKLVDLPYPLHGLRIELNSTGVQSMRPSFAGLDQGYLSRVVHNQSLLLGAICGVSAYGTGGWAGVEFSFLTSWRRSQNPWTILTDGVVTLDECSKTHDGLLYGDFHQGIGHAFAIVEANHQGTCVSFLVYRLAFCDEDLSGAVLGLSLMARQSEAGAPEPIVGYLRIQVARFTHYMD